MLLLPALTALNPVKNGVYLSRASSIKVGLTTLIRNLLHSKEAHFTNPSKPALTVAAILLIAIGSTFNIPEVSVNEPATFINKFALN